MRLYLVLRCYIISPYGSFSSTCHPTRRINKDCKDLAVQLNQMEFSVDCILLETSGSNTNTILDELSTSSLHQLCNPYNGNDRISGETSCVHDPRNILSQRYGIYNVSVLLWINFEYAIQKYSAWKSEYVMDPILNRKDRRATLSIQGTGSRSFQSMALSLPPHATVESFQCKKPSLL